MGFFFAFVLFFVCSLGVLTDEDKTILRHMREDHVSEVSQLDSKKVLHSPSTLILHLSASGLKMICKNARLQPHGVDQIVSELHMFYLDRLLGLNLVPPVIHTVFSGSRFKTIRDRDVIKQLWRRGDLLVCSQFRDDLMPLHVPEFFKKQTLQLSVGTGLQKGWSREQKHAVEQWGQLMAFDFLTGVTDRLMKTFGPNDDGFKPRNQRRKSAISFSTCLREDCKVENAFVTSGGDIVLVDNNSGLLYDKADITDEPNLWFLSDTCVFPSSFVKELRKRNDREIKDDLYRFIRESDEEAPIVGFGRTMSFMKHYKQLRNHIEKCLQLYEKISFL